jgi:hypothetical protein
MLALSLLLALAAAPTCPDAAAVDAALRAAHVTLGEFRIRLSSDPEGVQLELLDAAGTPVALHVLPASLRCDALAEASAVLVEAWLTELDRSQRPVPPPPPVPAAPSTTWEAGLGVEGFISSAGLTGGALLEAAIHPGGGAWALRLEGGWEGRRTEAIGPGQGAWDRFTLSLGLALTVRAGSLALVQGYGELTGALLSLRGLGFTTDSSALGEDLGLCAGLRVSPAWKLSLRPWLGAAATYWTRSSQLDVGGVADTPTLPRWEVAATLGVSWPGL